MEPGERIAIIRRVAAALADVQWVDMNLTLDEFGFRTWDPSDHESTYEYAVAVLRQGDDQALRQIDAYLLPADPGGESPALDVGPWGSGTFRLFISHTTANRERASALASALERCGVDGFVAHDSIEPTREWQTEIERALATCDALCAFITPDFVESRWCDQEVGFVIARRKLILPLKMGADPHGFIGKFQALTVSQSATANGVADQVLSSLAGNALTVDAVAPAIVRRYARSGSFDSTRTAYEMLRQLPDRAWTQDMIEQTDRAARENNQVEHANVADGTGRSIPALVSERVAPLRERPTSAADDDIPF